MQNGICPKCNSSGVYFKPCALNNVTMDGRGVDYADYVCTECEYFQTYITDKDVLKKIEMSDWKKAK